VKNLSVRPIIICILLILPTSSFSQESELFNDLWTNWIRNSLDYAERNYDVLPAPFPKLILNGFLNKNYYTSEIRNKELLRFIHENFFRGNEYKKIYFIQQFSGFGCTNNYSYYILEENRRVNIYWTNKRGFQWKTGSTRSIKFIEFEEKFNQFLDVQSFEPNSKSANVFQNYYLITRFEKGNVTTKLVKTYIEI
jgi:hypothetical protein